MSLMLPYAKLPTRSGEEPIRKGTSDIRDRFRFSPNRADALYEVPCLTDILIIGGGIAGLLTAGELSLAGARVTILERNERPARESSWAGGGILSPLYPWRYADSITRLSLWGQQTYPELCADLKEATGIDPQHLRSGLFIHAPDEMDEARNWADRFGQHFETVAAARIHQLEPERLNPPSPMLWFPEIAQVRNPRLVKSLLADLERRGVAIHANTPVDRLEITADGSPVPISGGRRWQAEKVVICAGAWSGRLLESLQPAPRIHPVRGQMLLFRARPGLIRHMMLEENRYIIPRKDGRVLFGSTLEETGFDKQTTKAAREELHRIATSRFPVLTDFPVEAHWAGLRPASPSGIPYIGPHPECDRLFVNAGHYRNGVVLGPASARLTADLVLERKPFVDPEPYGLDAERVAGQA